MPLIRFDSVTIDAVTRTAIRALVDCHVVTLTNADLVNDCTLYDAETGGGSRPLAAGQSVTYRRRTTDGGQWGTRDVMVWAIADAGTGPIRLEYLL